jgi:Fe-S cluster assembly ATPase SufC
MQNNLKLSFTSIKGIPSVFQSENFSVLIGQNGSGKLELLKLIYETHSHRNSDGEVIEFTDRQFYNFGKDVDSSYIGNNSLILIANIEYGLDPANIRKLIEKLDNLIDEKNCVVIGITYSPIVLNEFTEKEYSIFVFPDDLEKGLTPLDKFKDPVSLALFQLGTLYDREKLF